MGDQDHEVNEAMMAADGDISAAAIALEITTVELRSRIRKSTELNKLWGDNKGGGAHAVTPDELSTLSRKISPDLQSPSDPILSNPVSAERAVRNLEDAGRALAEAQKLERNGLEATVSKLGWSAAISSLAGELYNLSSNHFIASMNLMHGGLVNTFLQNAQEHKQLQPAFELVMEALEDTETYPIGSKEREDVMREAERLHRMMTLNKDNTARLNDVVHKSAIVAAAMKRLEHLKKDGKDKPRGKPGRKPGKLNP